MTKLLAVLMTGAALALSLFAMPAHAADGPVITSLTCISSAGAATLTNVMPASTQVIQLSAASGDLIRCEVVVSGSYTSLQWRGPNDDYGAQTTFATAVGGPRHGGAPYDIGLTVNWGGNPLMAHVSVLPDARAQVITIAPGAACFIILGIPFYATTPVIPATVGCLPAGVPYTGTSTITIGY